MKLLVVTLNSALEEETAKLPSGSVTNKSTEALLLARSRVREELCDEPVAASVGWVGEDNGWRIVNDNKTKAKQDRKNFYQIKNDFEGLFEPPTIARNEANIKRLDEKYQNNKGFKEILSILRENSDALLEYKYRSGLISGIEYQKLKSLYPHYVPLSMNRDLIERSQTKKHGVKYIAMPRVVGDGGVYALRWFGPNFKRLKFGGARDEHLTSCLQNFNGSGWVHPNGTVGAMDKMTNAVEYLKQICKPEKTIPTYS